MRASKIISAESSTRRTRLSDQFWARASLDSSPAAVASVTALPSVIGGLLQPATCHVLIQTSQG